MYGFPRLTTGVKASIFHDGETVPDPDVRRRPADAAETGRLQEYLGTFMPALRSAPVRATMTCVFTNTSDGRFIIDRHPAHPQVIISSPCSGHGFKFSSAVGEARHGPAGRTAGAAAVVAAVVAAVGAAVIAERVLASTVAIIA